MLLGSLLGSCSYNSTNKTIIRKFMKKVLLILISIFMSFNFMSANEISLDDFIVNYQIVPGKELNSLFKLGEKNKSDYFYIIGKVKSKLKKNAFIDISFENNERKSFKTNNVELGWVDGNDSAEKYFLIPIGIRGSDLPQNPYDISCRIDIKMIK